MGTFLVRMPSGERYWTVVDGKLEVVAQADRYLRDLKFGQDRAEATTKSYAGAVALFLRWCSSTGRDWRTAADDLAMFILWLKYTPATADPGQVVVLGPGSKAVRGERRINVVLTAVRGFLSQAVADDVAPACVLGQIYLLADTRDLPIEARAEDSGLRYRLRAHHRLHEPERAVERASDAEILALLRACRSARDRLIVLLLARAGLRRSEAVGLRRCDMHLMAVSRSLGCSVEGSHLHVVRRENVNGAWAKSRRSRAVPVDFLLVQAADQYEYERTGRPEAAGSDFLLVNLFRAPVGSPMPPDAINELVEALTRRAGIDRNLTPHMLRHAYASNVADAGGALDEVQTLLGHAYASSSQAYLHPSASRLREAVERVGSPRVMAEEVQGW